MRQLLFFLIVGFCNLILNIQSCHSQTSTETDYYFYHNKNYGSDSIFNPLTTILNGGFGILQISNRSNNISDVHFQTGFKNVTYNLSHPFSSISHFGWKEFISQELLPTSLKRSNAQYFPNFELHMIGGGATFRMFTEWYRWHNFSHPNFWAFGSWISYHFLNEVVENNKYSGPNVDPISDFYIFNTLGILLFSSDKMANFFGNTLNLRDWSFMPSFDPRTNTIENIGQNFVIKYPLKFWKPWSLIYHFGVHGTWGLSYKKRNGNSLSLTGGLIADDLIEIKNANGSRAQTTTLVWTFGFFYDLNNSLLTSLILSGTKGYKARLNIYPGVLKFSRLSPGIFINLRNDNQVVMGIHLNILPFGISGRF
jgi:hypothetical protein